LFDIYGAPKRLWVEHVRLAKASRDRSRIHAVLFTYASDRLKLSDGLWEAAVIEAIGSPGSLVVETSEFGPQAFDIPWPTGRDRRFVTDLLKAAHRAEPTVRATALWFATAVRGGDESAVSSSLRQLRRDALTSGDDARVVSAIATWCGRSGRDRHGLELLAPLVGWLAKHHNQLAAFALASRLSEMAVRTEFRRWHLSSNEKEAAR